jgi:hypothetical protein|tara:strand:+ start:1189 stop:1401 length:213 start_codon:yes stop_codon:yes gene_type:complete
MLSELVPPPLVNQSNWDELALDDDSDFEILFSREVNEAESTYANIIEVRKRRTRTRLNLRFMDSEKCARI